MARFSLSTAAFGDLVDDRPDLGFGKRRDGEPVGSIRVRGRHHGCSLFRWDRSGEGAASSAADKLKAAAKKK